MKTLVRFSLNNYLTLTIKPPTVNVGGLLVLTKYII